MANDAKFGLVVGVALVIASAVMFFQRPATGEQVNPPAETAIEPKPNRPTAPAMLPPPGSLPKPARSPGAAQH